MEFLIGLLVASIFVGFLVRKKGDNTMDTASKGCLTIVLLAIAFFIFYMYWENYVYHN